MLGSLQDRPDWLSPCELAHGSLGAPRIFGVADRDEFLIAQVADDGLSLGGPHRGARRGDPRCVVAVKDGKPGGKIVALPFGFG